MSVAFVLKIAIKEKINFLFHRKQQVGGRLNQPHPINVLRRGPIIYYSINFYQHKNFYDFTDESIVDSFFIPCSMYLHLLILRWKFRGILS